MALYARIEAGMVMELFDTDADIATLFPPELVWVPAPKGVQERWVIAADDSFIPPPQPVVDIKEAVIAAVQTRLDDFARSREYDGILSACTYAPSSVAKFAAEGAYCVKVRDSHWNTCYQLLAAVQAGKLAVPTLDGVMAQMPALVWPV